MFHPICPTGEENTPAVKFARFSARNEASDAGGLPPVYVCFGVVNVNRAILRADGVKTDGV
jgi:hypothetical protein